MHAHRQTLAPLAAEPPTTASADLVPPSRRASESGTDAITAEATAADASAEERESLSDHERFERHIEAAVLGISPEIRALLPDGNLSDHPMLHFFASRFAWWYEGDVAYDRSRGDDARLDSDRDLLIELLRWNDWTSRDLAVGLIAVEDADERDSWETGWSPRPAPPPDREEGANRSMLSIGPDDAAPLSLRVINSTLSWCAYLLAGLPLMLLSLALRIAIPVGIIFGLGYLAGFLGPRLYALPGEVWLAWAIGASAVLAGWWAAVRCEREFERRGWRHAWDARADRAADRLLTMAGESRHFLGHYRMERRWRRAVPSGPVRWAYHTQGLLSVATIVLVVLATICGAILTIGIPAIGIQRHADLSLTSLALFTALPAFCISLAVLFVLARATDLLRQRCERAGAGRIDRLTFFVQDLRTRPDDEVDRSDG